MEPTVSDFSTSIRVSRQKFEYLLWGHPQDSKVKPSKLSNIQSIRSLDDSCTIDRCKIRYPSDDGIDINGHL